MKLKLLYTARDEVFSVLRGVYDNDAALEAAIVALGFDPWRDWAFDFIVDDVEVNKPINRQWQD